MPLYVIGVDTVGHICLCAYALSQDLHGNVKPPILLNLCWACPEFGECELVPAVHWFSSQMMILVFCLNVVRCALLRVVGSAPSIWLLVNRAGEVQRRDRESTVLMADLVYRGEGEGVSFTHVLLGNGSSRSEGRVGDGPGGVGEQA
ncbi:hypothetical protein B0H14DRAFT_2659469 [Mycena olivaceomarginata]|nr:hypothetical protein B0H14DRAFT_2659469 [Mycena olivaceomarginata]